MSDIGTGVTIVFATSGFTAQIGDVSGDGIERPVIATPHHGVADNSVPKLLGDLVDQGEVTFDFFFDPDDQPPVDGAAETITITFRVPSGLTNGATLVGVGGLTSWSWGAPVEEAMTGNGTITWTAKPAWTDAS